LECFLQPGGATRAMHSTNRKVPDHPVTLGRRSTGSECQNPPWPEQSRLEVQETSTAAEKYWISHTVGTHVQPDCLCRAIFSPNLSELKGRSRFCHRLFFASGLRFLNGIRVRSY
jgi:hypothetical protein